MVSLLVDSVAVALSILIALLIYPYLPHTGSYPSSTLVLTVAIFWVVLVLSAVVAGVYRGTYRVSEPQQYKLAGKAYILAVFAAIAALSLLQGLPIPRRFTVYFLVALPMFFMMGRKLLHAFNLGMQKKGFGITNALVLCRGKEDLHSFARFKHFPELGYRVKAVVSERNDLQGTPEMVNGSTVSHYALLDLRSAITSEKIDIVLLPSVETVKVFFSEIMDICQKERVIVRVISRQSDDLLLRARIYDIVGITLYAPLRFKVERIRLVTKEVFDRFVAFLLMLVCSPIFLLVAVAIFVESGRPIFFKQKRSATRGSSVFEIFKFRSMRRGAEKTRDSMEVFNESDGALFKMRDDPRITKVGRFLRKFSIDELPQLVNILRGEMSFVGPRPLPASDFEMAGNGEQVLLGLPKRGTAKPGLTGLWQVSGRSELGFAEMLLLDLYYIDNQSLSFDLEILLETLPVVLLGKGAY
jgi:exopolysaccharide biosynthesis polyprenyl glycosylphosphotransferase